jgi:hypothetical protein
MPTRTEACPAKAALRNATGRLPLLRLFSTPLIDWISKAFPPTATTLEELRSIANYVTIWLISSMLTVHSSPDWKFLYEAAIRETDRSKLAEQIATARSAILDHIEESIRNPAIGEH